MPPLALLSITLAILLVGGLAIWVASRRSTTPSGGTTEAPPELANMGYGSERRHRELALWRGVLRRLEIQARHQSPVSDMLQRQLAEARAKIAEAERHIAAR